MSECEIQIRAGHTHPVADPLTSLVCQSLLGGTQAGSRSSSLLRALRLLLGGILIGFLLFLFLLSLRGQFKFDVSRLLLGKKRSGTALVGLVPQKMIGFSVPVLPRLLFLTAVALLPSEEVVILTRAADPATIREVKLLLRVGILFLGFTLIN